MGRMMVPTLEDYPTAEIVLMLVVWNKHYHLLILDKVKKEYIYHSFIESPVYNQDANSMVTSTCEHLLLNFFLTFGVLLFFFFATWTV